MASTINASTSAGLVNTADTSGVLQLQTAGTTALTVDASQNVGIGTTTPAGILHLKGADPIQYFEDSSGTSSACSIQNANGVLDLQADNNATVANSAIKLSVDSVEIGRFTSTGLGIGTSSPAYKLDVQTAAGRFQVRDQGGSSVKLINATSGGNMAIDSGSGGILQILSNGTETARFDAAFNFGIGTTTPAYKLNIVEAKTLTPTTGDGQIAIDNSTAGQVSAILMSSQGTRRAQISAGLGGTGNDGYLAFTTRADGVGFSERSRIGSNGNIYWGCTSVSAASMYFTPDSNGGSLVSSGSTGSKFVFYFQHNNSTVGYISSNSGGVNYTSTSDYRLKNTIAPMTGALAKVALLKPCTYKWNHDNSNGQGFIAHELQEFFPDAVVGVKDEVDESGKIKPQGIDTGFLVATLTAAIQEQQAMLTSQAELIAQLTARLDAANL